MTIKSLCIFSLVLSIAAPPAFAHDFWIEPATHRPAAGQSLSIRFLQGEHFRGEPVARNDARIERFVIRGSEGERAVGGATGDEPAGRIARVVPGDAVIGYRTRPLRHGKMSAERFEAYLREEGLERIIELRAARGESARGAAEIYSRSAKSLLQPAEPAAYGEPLGFRLELIPETDPHDTAAPAVTMRVLFEGSPVAGVLVTAIHHDTRMTVDSRTDGEGRVILPVPKNGRWLIKAVHMIKAPEGSGADWESIWATLTFERPR